MAMVQFLGHAAFYVEGNGIRALIDPLLSGNPQAPEKVSELKPNYIFVTHAHQDHLGDTIRRGLPSWLPMSLRCTSKVKD